MPPASVVTYGFAGVAAHGSRSILHERDIAMFGSWFQRRPEEVRRLLSRYINRDFAERFRNGARQDSRSLFSRAVWIIPFGPRRKPNFDAAYAVVTKDLSAQGIAVLHTSPIADSELVVAIPEDQHLHFVRCEPEHSTTIGLGFYQTGLQPKELVYPESREIQRLLERSGLEKDKHPGEFEYEHAGM